MNSHNTCDFKDTKDKKSSEKPQIVQFSDPSANHIPMKDGQEPDISHLKLED